MFDCDTWIDCLTSYAVAKRRDVEVEIASAYTIYIDCDHDLRSKPFPKSMNLLKSVNVSSVCHSVCYHEGKTYLGTQSQTVDVIDGSYNLNKSFIKLNKAHWAYGITVHDNKIYALVSNKPGVSASCTINVYGLSGRLINSWKREDTTHYVRHAIVSDHLVVPDISNKRLTLYSLNGQVLKHIALSKVESGSTRSAICAIDKDSVIMANTSQVFRVNITTEEMKWACSEVNSIYACAMYGKDYVCTVSNKKITFLNINTGE